MKCPPGPHHLEPSSLPHFLSCFISLFVPLRHTPLTPSLHSITLLGVSVTWVNTGFDLSFVIVRIMPALLVQGVGPVPAGLASDLGRGGRMAGVWRDCHQQPLGPEPWQEPWPAAGPGEHKRWGSLRSLRPPAMRKLMLAGCDRAATEDLRNSILPQTHRKENFLQLTKYPMKSQSKGALHYDMWKPASWLFPWRWKQWAESSSAAEINQALSPRCSPSFSNRHTLSIIRNHAENTLRYCKDNIPAGVCHRGFLDVYQLNT